MKNNIYCVSDHTGITVEGLARSLLSQFKQTEFEYHVVPYINDEAKVNLLIERLDDLAQAENFPVIVFSSIANPRLRELFFHRNFQYFDVFNTFLPRLEIILQSSASSEIGLSHSVVNNDKYMLRIEAIDYALLHDDGLNPKHYDQADIILVGVSRSGKTPTCLYMAIQFGVRAANYPMTEEDLITDQLPRSLLAMHDKLFGLLIDAERLHQIRSERLPNSRYSSLEQCRHELHQVKQLFLEKNIPFLDTTHLSIEEISTQILLLRGIEKRLY